MTKVYLLPAGTMGIPMPALRKGDTDRKLPGGFPPSRPRNVFRSLVGHQSRKSPKRVEFASPKWYEIERQLKSGDRVYDTTV